MPWSLTNKASLHIRIATPISPVPRSVSVGRITGDKAQACARPPSNSPTLPPPYTQAQPQPQP